MPTVGFEPTISAGERPQTYALDRAATGTGIMRAWAYILCKYETILIQAWRDSWGCRSLRFPGILDSRYMKVARLSDQCSGHFYPQEIFLVLISVRG